MRSSTTKPFVQGHLAKHCALDSGCLSGTHVLDSETTIICLSVNMYALSSPVGTTTFLILEPLRQSHSLPESRDGYPHWSSQCRIKSSQVTFQGQFLSPAVPRVFSLCSVSVDILVSPSIRCPYQLVRGPRHYRIRASKMSWTCLHCNSIGRGMMSLYYRQNSSMLKDMVGARLLKKVEAGTQHRLTRVPTTGPVRHSRSRA
ncbi:hypothetical protein BKA83DRAFT_1690896 [Pisolithus microcarpus]|nr:hypothetical protein BKA83DRAFT_1690896 [Pisolithus microcarpus]